MKYFSEKTRKLYNDEAALRKAEADYDAVQAKIAEERERAAQERRDRAKEVEEAYQKAVELAKPAREAERRYLELRNKFVKDYGSYHMTVRGPECLPSPIEEFLKCFF